MSPPAAPDYRLDGDSHLAYHAPHNPWLIAVVATLATFMQVLDTTIVNVALPYISGSLGADVSDSTWILTAYLVSSGIILPISAWLSSLIGRKNFYMLSVALFTFSSFLCGFSTSMPMLVFFRLLQGIGGGGLQPATQSILVDTFPAEKRGMGMAVFGMTVVAAPVIGPTLGGWLTDNLSWRWVFFINIPVGAISLLLTSRFISDPPYLRRRKGKDRLNIDFLGLGFLCVGLGSLQLVLDLGERKGWFGSDFIVIFSGLAFVGLVSLAIWELLHHDPAVELRLLGNRNLGLATLTMLAFGVALYGSTVLLPLFMQTLLGYTATLSGLAISPGGLMVMALMPLVGWMMGFADPRKMIAFGMAIIAVALWGMSHFNLNITFWNLVDARLLQSFGLAFIFVPVSTMAYSHIPASQRDSASSLISLTRNIGGSVGIALASTIVTRHSQVHQVYLTSQLTTLNAQFAAEVKQLTAYFLSLTGDPVGATRQAYGVLYGMLAQQTRTLAFADAFRIMATIILPGIPLSLLMKRAPAHGKVEIVGEQGLQRR